MTRFQSPDDDEPFEVSADPNTAGESAEFEGANVCRVAMLSTRFSDDRVAMESLAAECRELGLFERVIAAELSWRDTNLRELFAGLPPEQGQPDEARVQNWQALNESGRPRHAVRFLVGVLGSSLERESAAAAAALWRQIAGKVDQLPVRGPRLFRLWDRLIDLELGLGPLLLENGWFWSWPGPYGPEPQDDEQPRLEWAPDTWDTIYHSVASRFGDPYTDPILVLLLVRQRLAWALRSADPITVSFAMAAFQPADSGNANLAGPPPRRHQTPPGALVVSTMIHGTWGWKGDWWRPRSSFHEFILRNHRPNLYSRGAKFSWSGALREKQRIQAAADFSDWAYDVAPNGLQTVFAHSYGGEVAARAVLCGARIQELVLLSVPVTAWVELALPQTPRVIDVRLRFDPVLGLAQTRQRITQPGSNTEIVLLGQWRYSHSATHQEQVWHEEDIALRGRL